MTFGIESADWNICVDKSNGNNTFSNMTLNRKRSRDEESCEFMPLSKRINNLHINNNLASTSSNAAQPSSQQNGMSDEASTDTTRQPDYDPGVNSSQSPYYFDNKLLFQLHLERIQRTGQQFPF
ncbi:uncharacterized protein LOC105380129 isoform X1 [Plutella xylostella]|uniref:uncharacterized protein LOC105380129 isoform X1 n=1 Tax=Plutella xylostella TaxID=51655 RepID=UPI00203279AB|nr:uncharacterized protein LOC105380129 isoform X1 [Plutella xylostella]